MKSANYSDSHVSLALLYRFYPPGLLSLQPKKGKGERRALLDFKIALFSAFHITLSPIDINEIVQRCQNYELTFTFKHAFSVTSFLPYKLIRDNQNVSK